MLLVTVVPAMVGADGPARAPVRPRVGLVLSGGGARGGAHIGVLRVLEELRIPVDCIAGTSMGSIVGGLYAAGFSPARLEDNVLAIDWEGAFRDRPERQRLSFRRKEDDALPLLPLELGIGGGGARPPSGITSGARIEFLLRSLTLDLDGTERFDELPVPYRAVAADLDTGDVVVLDRGELATAMRASMSIPGVFSPVEVDGRLLVDGGIARNLPIDVARAMGADVVIAVDVGTPPRGAGEHLSAAGVYSQTFAVLSKENVRRQLELLRDDDVLIVPDLREVRTAGFGHIAQAIAAGTEAARAARDRLVRLSVSEEEFAAYLEKQRRPEGSGSRVRVDEVRVESSGEADTELLLRRMRTRAGAELDTGLLVRDLERVSQAGEFQSVGFHVERGDERNVLVVDARGKTWGPGYLKFGLGLESDLEGDTEVRLLSHYRRPGLNRLGGEWRTLASFGEPTGFETELFQPLERTGIWFVAPSASIVRRREEGYLANGDFETLQSRVGVAGVDIGIQLRNYGELRLGVFRGSVDSDPFTTTVEPSTERDLGYARFEAKIDQIDSLTFPTAGNRTVLSLAHASESLGSDDAYDLLRIVTLGAWSHGRTTLLGRAELGTSLGSDLPFLESFRLGGFLNLSGLDRGRRRGDVKALVTLGGHWKVRRLGSLGALHAGAFLEAGQVWDEAESTDLSDLDYGGTLLLGVDSRLLPIYVGLGHAEGGARELYVFIGKPFGG